MTKKTVEVTVEYEDGRCSKNCGFLMCLPEPYCAKVRQELDVDSNCVPMQHLECEDECVFLRVPMRIAVLKNGTHCSSQFRFLCVDEDKDNQRCLAYNAFLRRDSDGVRRTLTCTGNETCDG